MYKLNITFFSIVLASCSSLSGNVEYPNPSEDYIDIRGDISESLTYKINVRYITKSEAANCQTYHLMVGDHIQQSTEYEYYPVLENGSHQTHIPLKALDPDTECKWAPESLSLCVYYESEAPASCRGLFSLSSEHDGNDQINIECSTPNNCWRSPFQPMERINILNKSYEVNISGGGG